MSPLLTVPSLCALVCVIEASNDLVRQNQSYQLLSLDRRISSAAARILKAIGIVICLYSFGCLMQHVFNPLLKEYLSTIVSVVAQAAVTLLALYIKNN